jgi:hypothetical protein
MSPNAKLNPTFNDFLFATVCEERNAMPLSVISALARLDLDPWAEAAELARMPAEGAAQRLTSMLTSVVEVPPAQPDRATVSARLVALLPTAEPRDVPYGGQRAGALVFPHSRAISIMCLACLASMAVSLLLANLAPGASASGAAPTPQASARN